MASLASPSEQGQDGVRRASELDQERLTVELTKELIGLRAREGLVFEQVRDCEFLKAVARVWKNSQELRISSLDNASAAIAMIERLLAEEKPIEYRESLQLVYGLIVDGLSRDERVRRYLERPEGEKRVFSEPTIDRYSKAMAAQLAARLASIMAPKPELEYVATGSDADATEDDPSEPYRVNSLEKFIRFGSNRVIHDVLNVMRIQAVKPGEHTRHVSWEYFSDHSDGTVEIVPEFGCEAVGEALYEDGVGHRLLRLPRALKEGDSHIFTFRVLVHSTQPAHPPLVRQTPITDIDRFAIHIQFCEDAIPSEIWRFSLPSYYQTRQAQYRKQTPILHDGSRFVMAEWYGPRAGRSYGLTWNW